MNQQLLFDFTVDKPAKKVFITKEFDADLSLVWDAFTLPELLDQWIAPPPYKAKTKYMNFEVGGKRFYAMISPDGTKSWAIQTYTSITPKTNFQLYNAFADKDENPQPTGSEWDHTFIEASDITKVKITIYNESFERMEMLLEGFTAGFTASMNNLEALLKKLSGK